MTDVIDPLISRFVTVQGPSLVIILLVMLGYVGKMVTAFPNKYIPLVNFCVGPLLALFLVGWPHDTDMAPEVRFPEIAAWATAITRGFLLACIAWISHAQLLRKLIDDKIPALSEGRETEKSVKIEETAGPKGVEKTEQVTTTTTVEKKP